MKRLNLQDYYNIHTDTWKLIKNVFPELLKTSDGNLVEIMERHDHPWFLGVQFHPELKSTPFKPHPIFNSFIEALIKNSNNWDEKNKN